MWVSYFRLWNKWKGLICVFCDPCVSRPGTRDFAKPVIQSEVSSIYSILKVFNAESLVKFSPWRIASDLHLITLSICVIHQDLQNLFDQDHPFAVFQSISITNVVLKSDYTGSLFLLHLTCEACFSEQCNSRNFPTSHVYSVGWENCTQ